LLNTTIILCDQVINIVIATTSFDIALFSKIFSIYTIQVKFLISNRFNYRVDFKIALLNYCEKLIN
jgi:hypothetical protein